MVMRVGPLDGISTLIRRGRDQSSLSLHQVRTQEKTPCMDQEGASPDSVSALISEYCSLQNCEEYMSVV